MHAFDKGCMSGAALHAISMFDGNKEHDCIGWMCSTEPPSARAGASLCASEDGRRLWLFGGNAGSGSLNDLHFMDLETHAWTQVCLPLRSTAC